MARKQTTFKKMKEFQRTTPQANFHRADNVLPQMPVRGGFKSRYEDLFEALLEHPPLTVFRVDDCKPYQKPPKGHWKARGTTTLHYLAQRRGIRLSVSTRPEGVFVWRIGSQDTDVRVKIRSTQKRSYKIRNTYLPGQERIQ